MFETMSGWTLCGRRAPAMFGGIISRIIRLNARCFKGCCLLGRWYSATIFRFFSFFATATRPATFQCRKKCVGALCHRRRVSMMPVVMYHPGLTTVLAAPRRREFLDFVVPELRGAFRKLSAPVQIQSRSFLCRVI